MKIQVPGALWVALIVGIIPVVQQVIQQFYPEASYAWSALVVTALGVVLKTIQVYAQGSQPQIDTSINGDSAAVPAATVDGDDYTYARPKQPGKFSQVLFG
jgi:hypothetical protein